MSESRYNDKRHLFLTEGVVIGNPLVGTPAQIVEEPYS
jgi:hypothetical protein